MYTSIGGPSCGERGVRKDPCSVPTEWYHLQPLKEGSKNASYNCNEVFCIPSWIQKQTDSSSAVIPNLPKQNWRDKLGRVMGSLQSSKSA